MARKKQTFLILSGISLATLIYIAISGVQLGMRRYIFEQLLNNTAHVLISGSEQDILESDVTSALFGSNEFVRWISPPSGKREEAHLQNYSGWYVRLSADPDVLDFSPRFSANVLISNGKFNAPANLTGIIPEKQARITSIEKYMRNGSFNALATGGNHIVLGSELAKRLGVRLDQFVSVNGGRGVTRPFKIVGIVHYGNKPLDESIAFASLHNVQAVTKNQGRVTQIAVALLDPDNASKIASDWKLTSKDQVDDWKVANKAFMEMINVQDISRYIITFAILAVAAFGIYNVLTIMITQKRREIAILQAIGYGPRRILSLILYQGLALGISGGLVGLVLGFAMCKWIESIDLGLEIGGVNHLWLSYDLDIYVTAFITANVSTVIASILPAWSASRLTPMDIIRSES